MTTLKRAEVETIEWNAVCKQYKEAKEAGWDGMTERGHPLEQWVQKQRTLHSQGRLQDWKRKALRDAKFDFVAPRNNATPSNEQYAHELVAFYLKHGHWSPTQTFGGAGLTKWWTKMRISGGRVGILSQSSESAQAATKILRERIPGFSFRTAAKSEVNRSAVLSFNGFAKEAPATIWDQDPNVLGARRYGALTREMSKSLELEKWKQADGLAVCEVVSRAAMFSQAVAVDIAGGESIARYWLVSVSTPTGKGITLSVQDATTLESRTLVVELGTIRRSGYSPDGGRYETSMQSPAGLAIRLSYDAYLADQTANLDTDRLGDEVALRILTPQVNWEEWLEGRGPERRHNAKTTSNRTFNDKVGKLLKFVFEERSFNGAAYVPHISWANEFVHYKFIEHVVLKRREGKLKFSHAERLMAVPVTWGKDETALHDIVGRVIEWH